jgi:hydrogenase expression/formation protein HypE
MNIAPFIRSRPLGKVHVPTVTLSHGGGGRAMKDLIDDVFVEAFNNAALAPLEDQARFDLLELAAHGDRLAFTTDSFVVDPLFFPGGDIGKLATCGTINDLAVGGAKPLYLSCAVIVEEGVTIDLLRQIAGSMARTAKAAGVEIVTGDTKVVQRGACDKLFLTTTGIGVIRQGLILGAHLARPGDVILVNGLLGDHGAAILCARGDMALETPIESDCAPLHGLIETLLAAAPGVRFLRDPTRGGLATVLNEIADASQVAIEIDEAATPIREEVKAFCEILGLDPLYLANEGKIVAIVPPEEVEAALAGMRAHPLGTSAGAIGRVHAGETGRVTMRTVFGGRRIVDNCQEFVERGALTCIQAQKLSGAKQYVVNCSVNPGASGIALRPFYPRLFGSSLIHIRSQVRQKFVCS